MEPRGEEDMSTVRRGARGEDKVEVDEDGEKSAQYQRRRPPSYK